MMASRKKFMAITRSFEMFRLFDIKRNPFSSGQGNEIHFVTGANHYDKSLRTLKITDSTIKVRLFYILKEARAYQELVERQT